MILQVIRRETLHPGDIVLVTAPDDVGLEAATANVGDLLKDTGVQVMGVPKGYEIRWIRPPSKKAKPAMVKK